MMIKWNLVEILRDIKVVLYIYDTNEYDAIILSSEYIMIADKPYKKRTHLEVPLKVDEEV